MKFILTVLFLLIQKSVSELVVTVSTGKIQGYAKTSPSGKVFHAFQGIPFGKNPTRHLRFQAPVPAEKWTGTLKTQKERDCCFSVHQYTKGQSEDCLYINVYTPVLTNKTNSKLAVMFDLFPGGFRGGCSSYGVYGPDFLLEEDVIVVMSNYRTGPFGFLSTEDKIVPGNAGLKDMVLALKWIQTNIKQFGGDPQKITIFGQSAGAAAVGLLVISKAAAGLFRGAIAESGSGISNWAYQTNPLAYARELTSKITSHFSNSSVDMLKILQNATGEQVHNASGELTITKDALPVIEVANEGAILTKSMYESLETGDFNRVPLLIGGSSEEYISLADDMEALKARATGYENKPAKLPPPSFNIKDKEKLKQVGKEIKKIYIKDDSKWQDSLGLAIAYRSESHFFNPCVRHAELQSNYTDVYFYKFSYVGKMGRNKNYSLEGAEKCTHGEEMYYFFRTRVNNYDNSDLSKFPSDDIVTHNRMVKWWTNFAKYLNPLPETSPLFQNITWPKVKPNNIRYMDIDKTLVIKSNVKNGRYEQWKQIFEKYAIPPYVTF